MNVIIDSTVIFDDWHLNKVTSRLFLENIESVGHTLLVPEVVLLECINRFRETVSEKAGKVDANLRGLREMLGRPAQLPDTINIESRLVILANEYSRNLRWLLTQRGARILPVPPVRHAQILKRDLSRRKPFTETGKGYRDTLIWEAILKDIRNHRGESYAFVTHNHKDFAGKDGALHPHLADDLEGDGNPRNAVSLFPTLHAFVDSEILPHLPEPHRAFLATITQSHPEFSLEQALENELLRVLPGEEFDASTLGIANQYENPTVSMVDRPTNVKIQEERELEEGSQRLLRVTAQVECYFDCFIFKSDYYCLPDDDAPAVQDWNDHYFLTEIPVVLELDTYLTVDLTTGRVTSFELLEAEESHAEW